MKENGFTLIELLTVIIVISIISVITVPIVLNTIEKSKKSTSIDSAYGYVDAVNKYYFSHQIGDSIDEIEMPDGNYLVDGSGNLVYNDETFNISVSGSVPEENSWVELVEGDVVAFSLKFGDYVVTKYEDTEIEIVKNQNIAMSTEARLELERQTRAKATALSTISSVSGGTEIVETENYWVAFINGDIIAYSIKVTEGDYTYVVTDLDVNSNSTNAVADRTTNTLASKTSAEQAIVSYKVDTYVKAALTANSSLTDETVKEVSELSSVTTNPGDSGWIRFNKVNNSVVVVDYSLTYGSYTANYSSLTNGDYVSTFGDARTKPAILAGTTQADGAKYLTTVQEVYYNPVSGAKNCSGEEGCMHWYLYSVKGDYANMMLDHNISDANSSAGAWAIEADYTAGLTAIKDSNNTVTGYQIGEGEGSKATSAGITYPSSVTSFGVYSSNKHKRGPVTALNYLKTATSGWITGTPKVPNASSTNEHIIPSSANGNKYQIDYTGYHARLITYEETGYLGCRKYQDSCPEWMKKGTKGESSTTYSNIYGYWTSSAYADDSDFAWAVLSNRSLNLFNANYTYHGVRPVITVNASDVLS